MTFYRKTLLPNGLRVITEEISHVRSASVGVWVASGSNWELPENMGISHLIEHLLFKGTTNRSAHQIAREIDGRGGNLNAFTAKEHTCYYAKVLDEHLSIALDVLADMLQNSLFDTADIAKEKGVIAEEIRMYEDAPDDLVHDLFAAVIWPNHSLGRPIVGTEETLRALTREEIMSYLSTHYTVDNMVIAVAGNIKHEQVVDLVNDKFHLRRNGDSKHRAWPPAPQNPMRSRALLREKDTEQTHFVLGVAGLPHDHDEIYSLHILNTVLGGSTSSRLFQEIREERGLAYSVYSYQSSFRDTGNFGIYAGISPAVVTEVLDLVIQGLTKVGEHGITTEELVEAKEQLKGQIMLGLESTSGRMTRLGRGELMLGRVLSPDQIIERIDNVSAEGIHALAHRLLIEEPRILSVVGPQLHELDLTSFGFEEVFDG